jgi:hypothetical protein
MGLEPPAIDAMDRGGVSFSETSLTKHFDKRSEAHSKSWMPHQEASICSIVQRLDPVCCFSVGEPTEEALGCETSVWMK